MKVNHNAQALLCDREADEEDVQRERSISSTRAISDSVDDRDCGQAGRCPRDDPHRALAQRLAAAS